jgi:hypothetical protein
MKVNFDDGLLKEGESDGKTELLLRIETLYQRFNSAEATSWYGGALA